MLGKTFAFLLPALAHIEAQPPLDVGRRDQGPIALVVAPTRELCAQICDEAWKLTKGSRRPEGGSVHFDHKTQRGGLWSAVATGGISKPQQLKEMEGGSAHLLVATPGRLLDFLRCREVSLARVTMLILDEADRMLEMGFEGEVRSISSQIRPERQMLRSPVHTVTVLPYR